jgi:hypothetical protein
MMPMPLRDSGGPWSRQTASSLFSEHDSYSYAYPEPDGYRTATVRPTGAFYHPDLREFILPYDAVRMSTDPDATMLEFLQDTYEAAANLGRWDRAALERSSDSRPVPA